MGGGGAQTQDLNPSQSCKDFMDEESKDTFLCWLSLHFFPLGVADAAWHRIGKQRESLLSFRVQASVCPGRQQEWQTCSHTPTGRGAKLGPLFTVCLFLSYWDLTDRVGKGQLVIGELCMPGTTANSANSKGEPVSHGRGAPKWV